ncbi:Heat shock protein 70 [Rhynchospora pubera]|uniref:Heat shock protein 70 n=1 Tax=Rhynchospora pubera TaxID=906938 RepID=A0AAV8G7T8_9POAL|nr:Heat shock protein 70 [Rhynchospora pubera]
MQNLVLVDVTPLSLGVGIRKGFEYMLLVVPKNNPIPTKMYTEMQTDHDNQTSIRFPIYEGESAETKYNNLLGEFTINGIDPAPKGAVKFDVWFDIDANGILSVSAQVKSTSIKNGIIIKQNGDLTAAEIQTMIQEAGRYRAEDEMHKSKISLEDLAEKLKSLAMDPGRSKSDMKSMEKAAEKALAWLERNPHADIDEINKRRGQLKTNFPILCEEN